MNIHAPRIWLAFFSGTAVFLLALRDAGKITPGDLAEVHERVPELADRDGCVLCHGGGGVTMGDSCLECHDRIDQQLDLGDGLHGMLDERVVVGCALCHGDHHGNDFKLINDRSFVLAGSPKQSEFDHDLIGFDMHGKHLELSCAECHENADVDVLEEGTTRFLGLDQSCVQCHEDPHEGQMTRSCAECHGQESFEDFKEFVHDERFPLTGSHADVSCIECHQSGDVHSVEHLDSSGAASVRGCVDCHESPHKRPFLRRIAGLEGVAPRESCTTCHLVEHDAFAGIDLQITPEQHACSGFVLAPPHEEVSCADCHGSQGDTFADRYPGRQQESCGACHTDPHEGQFEDSAFSGGCLDCHDKLAFEPHQFTPEKHEETRLSLAGGHADQDCSACHEEPKQDVALIFADAEHRCEACHEDGHAGFFASFATKLEPIEEGECARCHQVTEFSDVPASHFDHEFWTGFGVRGAHLQNSCETCHPRSAAPDDTGRTFGRATETFGRIDGCATCHVDPHEGQFDRPDSPVEVEGTVGCARCHVETSFRSLELGFNHEKWTGFSLDGTHAEISCSECHAPVSTDRPDGRSFARARGTSCIDCHGDPHAGQFQVEGSTDCLRCHSTSAHAFSELSFDHDVDSRFPLEDAHRTLACSECHRPWKLGEGFEVVRYRPLGTDCKDCHGSSKGGHARRRKRKK